ncbi:hypothetical protein FHW58_000374 [Duganella sp. 1224]|uniref:hypothetical protein n=1 Tax=Duganella sp. 1224 TaxID=2587052 RepID=UPI0015C86EEC|nr:hypothetical protein [Duganella sp. 1224]NYE59222.1 hypothetical protein [Duganella sp. 1224]
MANKLVNMLTSLGAAKSKKPKGGDLQDVLSNVPLDAMQSVKHVFDNVTEYLKIAEQEQTNRANIAARRDVALEQIRSQRDTINLLIQRTFDERGQVLAKQFEALDRALANGDVAIVQASLQGMVAVIQTSPFKTIQDMQQALGSKDFVVRLE